MVEALEIDMDFKIAEALGKNETALDDNKAEATCKSGQNSPDSTKDINDKNPSEGIKVSIFDYSVENHFRAMDMISKLCGEDEFQFDQREIQRLSSSILFLREWRQFNYKPRIIRFACESETPQRKDVTGEINLSQFSAATIPKRDQQSGNTILSDSSKDFVMYVGGPVWALDWCPRVHQKPDRDTTTEFVAVAAHPPESSYHKIGGPLIGRGMIQIWCLLSNSSTKEEKTATQNPWNSKIKTKSTQPYKQRGRPRKTPVPESTQPRRPIGRPRKTPVPESTQPSRPRGRPRKTPVSESADNLNLKYSSENRKQKSEAIEVESTQPEKKARGRLRKKPKDDPKDQYVQAHADQIPGDSSGLIPLNEVCETICEEVDQMESGHSTQVVAAEAKQNPSNCEKIEAKSTEMKKARGSPRKKPRDEQFPEYLMTQLPVDEVSGIISGRVNGKESDFNGDDISLLKIDEKDKSPIVNHEGPSSCGEDPVGQESENGISNGPLEMNPAICLPRAVLCLAHNGKVAWDIKWQPTDYCETKSKHRMGYLAVLLGNGALEVWEVPSPNAVRAIYSASRKEGTDPRFVKLDPVFRCSMLKCGDRQSMPLTVEWSTSPPHDLILAGCHDGVVALWKFAANASSRDTRPLLCFNADTVPIRALAWAPIQSDLESANVIVTAGHRGLKFWDIRDPFHPLWDLIPARRVICSLDWLPEPRCILVSFDDGTIRLLSLSKVAYDFPVTGKPFVERNLCLPSYYVLSYTIWSIQASRTGMVAYCCADGTVLRFLLTTGEGDKERVRDRTPHFPCGSITEDESTLTVNTPFPNVPFPMKKCLNELGDAPRTMRGYLSVSHQAKRAKEEMGQMAKVQTSNDQPLDPYYDDDAGLESETEDIMEAQKSNKAAQTKTVERGEIEKGGEVEDEIEVLPPKIIAMHRVRWNMNKGSEKWLCYGGASGILRCQEVNLYGSGK